MISSCNSVYLAAKPELLAQPLLQLVLQYHGWLLEEEVRGQKQLKVMEKRAKYRMQWGKNAEFNYSRGRGIVSHVTPFLPISTGTNSQH